MHVAVPPIFARLNGSLYGLGSLSANQTIGVNSSGTAWAARTPLWLDATATAGQVPYASATDTISLGTPDGAGLLDKSSTAQTKTGPLTINSAAGTKIFDVQKDGSSAFAIRTSDVAAIFAGTLVIPGTGLFFNAGPNPTFARDATSGGLRLNNKTDSTFWFERTGAGSGPTIQFQGQSSTTSGRAMHDAVMTWLDSTDATRKARVVHSVYDTAAREYMRADASGTAAKIGFLGANAVARPTVAAAATDAATTQTLVNDIRSALVNLGLAA